MNSEKDQSSFVDRLKMLIGDEKPYPWANRLGIAQATFNRIWKDGWIPKGETLLLISEKTGCSIDWLLTGEGEMRRGNQPAVKEAAPGQAPTNGHPASKSERTRVVEIGGEPVPQPEHERLDRNLLFITIARLHQVFKDFGIDDPQDQAGVITDVYSHIIEKHLDRTDSTVDGLAKTMNRLFADVELLKSLPTLGLGFLSKIPRQLWERFKPK